MGQLRPLFVYPTEFAVVLGCVLFGIGMQFYNQKMHLYLIFVLFKHKFYRKNCRLQQDSNSDCRSRRLVCWPLDHHHGPKTTTTPAPFSFSLDFFLCRIVFFRCLKTIKLFCWFIAHAVGLLRKQNVSAQLRGIWKVYRAWEITQREREKERKNKLCIVKL